MDATDRHAWNRAGAAVSQIVLRLMSSWNRSPCSSISSMMGPAACWPSLPHPDTKALIWQAGRQAGRQACRDGHTGHSSA